MYSLDSYPDEPITHMDLLNWSPALLESSWDPRPFIRTSTFLMKCSLKFPSRDSTLFCFKTVKGKQSQTLKRGENILPSNYWQEQAQFHSGLHRGDLVFESENGSAEQGNIGNSSAYQRQLVSVIRPAVFASRQLWKLGFYPPSETVRQRLHPSRWSHFKGMAFRSWRKALWITGDTHISKNRGRIHYCKLCCCRKGRARCLWSGIDRDKH
jgi:hypothetical protein